MYHNMLLDKSIFKVSSNILILNTRISFAKPVKKSLRKEIRSLYEQFLKSDLKLLNHFHRLLHNKIHKIHWKRKNNYSIFQIYKYIKTFLLIN